MTDEEKRYHEEDLQRLRGFRPLDDDFMRMLLRNNKPLAELILQIILNKSDLRITEETTQYDMKRLVGARSICLDAYCTDDSQKRYDVEVQRADAGARPHRARYHSSAMDVENLSAGQEFEELPDTYTIFITENDVYGLGKAVYPIERTNLGTGEPFNDGEHILYVNGAYEGESDIGKLMHDFRCTDGKDMNFELLAQRTDYYKNTEEGVSEVCKVMEDMRNEVAEKAAINRSIEIAREMLKDGISVEKTAQYSQLSIAMVEELKRTMDASA